MAKTDTYVGIDVGTSKVAIVAGQVQEGLIHITGVGKSLNSGMRKGMIVDIEESVSAISAALEEAEKMAGVPLEIARIGLGGSHISSTTSKGVIAVSRADGEITKTDVERVVEAARAVALPPNREIIHVIPRDFIVDGQAGVKDPTGMTAIRLETEALVIGGQSAALKNLTKCIFQAGLQIDEIVYTPLAIAENMLTKKQKEIGAVLIDLGAGTTTLTVFEEGELVYTTVLNIGSAHITNDLAIGLRTSIETAERIKLDYGSALPEKTSKVQKVDLKKIDPNEDQKIERTAIAEIIEARLKELFGMISQELKSIGKDGMLPAGAVLTGGGALLDGIVDLTKDELKLPAHHGKISIELGGMVDKIDSPVYAGAIGLLLTGISAADNNQSSRFKFEIPDVGGITGQVKKIFRQFLP